MAFTDKDREMLVKTHTTVNMMKESHDRRLAALEAEDKVLHKRINAVRKLFTGITTLAGTLGAATVAYFKIRSN